MRFKLEFPTIDIKNEVYRALKTTFIEAKLFEIVKHRNELNDFELGKLSPIIKSFTYLVYKIKDKDKVVIYDEAMENDFTKRA